MTQDAVTHDVLLARKDGSKRTFRVYGRPMPGHGDDITLPVDGRLIRARVVDGRLIRARVTVSSDKPEMDRSVDAELVELVK